MRVCTPPASQCVRVRTYVCMSSRAREKSGRRPVRTQVERSYTHINTRSYIRDAETRSWRSGGVHTQYSQSHPRGRPGGIYFIPPPIASRLPADYNGVRVRGVRNVRVRVCACVRACIGVRAPHHHCHYRHSNHYRDDTTTPPLTTHGHAPRHQTGNVYGSSRRYVTELGGGGGSCVTLSRRRHVSSVTNNYALGSTSRGV
ncbi:hypothetical protein QTP88_021917 [Uroleucon formosanum]